MTSRWLDVEHNNDAELPVLRKDALDDLLDIHRADTLVALEEEYPLSGGRLVEFGFALARGKRIVVVGQRGKPNYPSIFHLHPNVEHYLTIEEIPNESL